MVLEGVGIRKKIICLLATFFLFITTISYVNAWGLQKYQSINYTIPSFVPTNGLNSIDVSGYYYYFPFLHGTTFSLTLQLMESDFGRNSDSITLGDDTIANYTETLYESNAEYVGTTNTIYGPLDQYRIPINHVLSVDLSQFIDGLNNAAEVYLYAQVIDPGLGDDDYGTQPHTGEDIATIDSTPPPTPSPKANPSDWAADTTPNIYNYGVIDSESGVDYYEYQIDSTAGSWTSVGLATNFNTPSKSDGTHIVYVRAVDKVGNIGGYGEVQVYIDTTIGCECNSGECCSDGCHYDPTGTKCQDSYNPIYTCTAGNSLGSDVYVTTQYKECSGSSASCSGSWYNNPPKKYIDCSSAQYCANNGDTFCTSCSTTCDNSCQSSTCYGVDPDCTATGGSNQCANLGGVCSGGVCNTSLECTSDSCCDTSIYKFRSSAYKCQDDATTEYGCPWGTELGNDVGERHKDRYCSGSSSSCNGALQYDSWSVADDCSLLEICIGGNSACGITQCTWGDCCDNLTYTFRPSSYKCSADVQWTWGCPDGTKPGDDVYILYQDRYCSGNSQFCNGSISSGREVLYEACNISSSCMDNHNYCVSCLYTNDGCCRNEADGVCDPNCGGGVDTDCGACTSAAGDCCNPSYDFICDSDCVTGLDYDCGTTCRSSGSCPDGNLCLYNADCLNEYCTTEGKCQTPTCVDNVKNSNETDIDCGGSCSRCINSKSCNKASDCASNYCEYGACKEPDKCKDGKLSPGEKDIDCGGVCPTKCSDGYYCSGNSDCLSNSCVSNICCGSTTTDDNCDDRDNDCDGSYDEDATCPQCHGAYCCDSSTGVFKPTSTICAVTKEYGCPWGTNSSYDAGVRYAYTYCTGSSAICSGNSVNQPWLYFTDCSTTEYCVVGSSTCSVCVDNDRDSYMGVQCDGLDCDDNNYYVNPEANEICDAIDSDCDGIVDENLTRLCGITETGACTLSNETCVTGSWSGCSAVFPTNESCDGIDSDCDGILDGSENLGLRQCYTIANESYASAGICSYGYYNCTDSGWSIDCIGDVAPAIETCNSLDDDCDGIVDEGCEKLYIKNSIGGIITFFDDLGNFILNGSLQQNSIYSPTSNDEFRFQDRNGNDVAIVDLTKGNMYIRGMVFENQNILNPSQNSNDFIILNKYGFVVAYINESGYMFLKGVLTTNDSSVANKKEYIFDDFEDGIYTGKWIKTIADPGYATAVNEGSGAMTLDSTSTSGIAELYVTSNSTNLTTGTNITIDYGVGYGGYSSNQGWHTNNLSIVGANSIAVPVYIVKEGTNKPSDFSGFISIYIKNSTAAVFNGTVLYDISSLTSPYNLRFGAKTEYIGPTEPATLWILRNINYTQ